MSKGKLRTALKNVKAQAAFELAKVLPKKAAPAPQLPEAESSSDDEPVQPVETDKPLSRKEKRLLKKLLAKQEEKAVEADEDDEEEDDDEEERQELDFDRLANSESESDLDDDDDEDDDDEDDEEEEDAEKEEEKEDEEEEDVLLSDVELDSDTDVVPHSKLTINNTAALKESLARVQLPWAKHAFTEHQSIVSAQKTEEGIKDIYDDTERELAFYRQGLETVKQGRATLLKMKVPFSRPLDYFAEMVKSDEHMDRLKGKLLKEAADKKASEDAKKQRQLKKFGKQVQHATLQDRAKQKRDTLDKIKLLKKKRGANEMSNDDDFQIALEEATAEDSRPKRQKPNGKRLAKDAKYGLGGKKRFLRKNDANSSADIYNQAGKAGKGGKGGKSARPGKSKRRKN